MTDKNTFMNDLQKAMSDVDNDLQKAMKKGTNAKREVIEGDESTEEKEAEGEEPEDEKEETEHKKEVEKAIGHLKKKGYKGHEVEEGEDEEMLEHLKEKGHSDKVAKAALKKYCGGSLKKALSGNDLQEEVIDATEILKGFIDSQDNLEKSLNAQGAKVDAILKSLSVFGKGLSFVMEQVNTIAETPLKKSFPDAKAVKKSFDQPNEVAKDETVIDINRDRSAIVKSLQSLAYVNPEAISMGGGMKVKDQNALQALQGVMAGYASEADLRQFRAEIEKSLGKSFTK